MRTNPFSLILTMVILIVGSVDASYGGGGHQVLILDMLKKQATGDSRLVVLDIESGKVISTAETGRGPEIGISPKGDVVAVLTYNRVGGRFRPEARMDTFRLPDLQSLERGTMPFKGRIGFQAEPTAPTIVFSPDGTEIIIQRSEQILSDDKPLRFPVNNGVWGIVKRELDNEGVFKTSRPDVKIRRCMYGES